ncbi:hypothetical protein ACJX0J_007031, partial [Zea mays]
LMVRDRSKLRKLNLDFRFRNVKCVLMQFSRFAIFQIFLSISSHVDDLSAESTCYLSRNILDQHNIILLIEARVGPDVFFSTAYHWTLSNPP